MKRYIVSLILVFFVFAGYGAVESGVAMAKRVSQQFLKDVERLVVELKKCSKQQDLQKVRAQFKVAQSKFMDDMLNLYNKYPHLRNESALLELKVISSKIDIVVRQYHQIRKKTAFRVLRQGKGSGFWPKSGLSKKDAILNFVAAIKKAEADLRAAQDGKQAGQIIVFFFKDMNRFTKIYPEIVHVKNDPTVNKAVKNFMKVVIAAVKKYRKNKNFQVALKSLRLR